MLALKVGGLYMDPEEEDKIVEALEQLRINFNLRQWKVCSLICESLAEKFKSLARRRESNPEK
jgi:hypothetical protein